MFFSDHIIIYYTDITTVLQKVPELHDLLSVLADINYEWYIIGISLQVNARFLDDLSTSVESNMVKLHKVLTNWRDTMSSPVTWQNIISAMEGPIVKHCLIADKIRKFLSRQEVYSKYQSM